jgi:hypothetical protein
MIASRLGCSTRTIREIGRELEWNESLETGTYDADWDWQNKEDPDDDESTYDDVLCENETTSSASDGSGLILFVGFIAVGAAALLIARQLLQGSWNLPHDVPAIEESAEIFAPDPALSWRDYP